MQRNISRHFYTFNHFYIPRGSIFKIYLQLKEFLELLTSNKARTLLSVLSTQKLQVQVIFTFWFVYLVSWLDFVEVGFVFWFGVVFLILFLKESESD